MFYNIIVHEFLYHLYVIMISGQVMYSCIQLLYSCMHTIMGGTGSQAIYTYIAGCVVSFSLADPKII